MNLERIYRVAITAYPAAACALINDPGDRFGGEVEVTPPVEGMVGYLTDDWEPKGWNKALEGAFYWPSTKRLYKSRSAAVARKNLIESYGAKAVVLVTEVEWVDERKAARQRVLDRATERAEKLRRKADLIIAMAAKSGAA